MIRIRIVPWVRTDIKVEHSMWLMLNYSRYAMLSSEKYTRTYTHTHTPKVDKFLGDETSLHLHVICKTVSAKLLIKSLLSVLIHEVPCRIYTFNIKCILTSCASFFCPPFASQSLSYSHLFFIQLYKHIYVCTFWWKTFQRSQKLLKPFSKVLLWFQNIFAMSCNGSKCWRTTIHMNVQHNMFYNVAWGGYREPGKCVCFLS